MIVLKTKHRAWKPNGPQQIDWTHPLTRGLAQCYLLDHAGPPTCLVRPDLYSLSFVDAPAWGPRSGGQGFYFDGSNDAAKVTIASGTAIEGQRFVSMGVVASWGTDAGTDRRMVGFRDESGTNPTWGLGTDDTAVQRFRGWFRTSATGFVELQSNTNTFGDNLPHAAIVITDAEYSAAPVNANKLYVDGKLEAEANSHSNWQASNMTFDNFSLGALYRAGAASSLFKGTIYLAAVWAGRLFSADELKAWSLEPYQILRPLVRRIWYLPAADGGTITATLDATLQKELSRTAQLSSALQKSYTLGSQLDAALQESILATAQLDAALQEVFFEEAVLNAALEKSSVLQTAIVGVLQKSNALSTAISAYLFSGSYITADLSAALQKTLDLSTTLNAALTKSYSQQVSIGAALQASFELSAQINAAIYLRKEVSTIIGSTLSKISYKVASLDAVLGEVVLLYSRLFSAERGDGEFSAKRGDQSFEADRAQNFKART